MAAFKMASAPPTFNESDLNYMNMQFADEDEAPPSTPPHHFYINFPPRFETQPSSGTLGTLTPSSDNVFGEVDGSPPEHHVVYPPTTGGTEGGSACNTNTKKEVYQVRYLGNLQQDRNSQNSLEEIIQLKQKLNSLEDEIGDLQDDIHKNQLEDQVREQEKQNQDLRERLRELERQQSFNSNYDDRPPPPNTPVTFGTKDRARLQVPESSPIPTRKAPLAPQNRTPSETNLKQSGATPGGEQRRVVWTKQEKMATYQRAATDPDNEDEKQQPEDTCMGRTLECCGSVPTKTLVGWIALVMGIAGCTGGMVVGIRRTRALLEKPTLLPHMEFIMMGIFLAMFLLGTLFLVAALVSSPRMSRRVFNTRNKNICGRVFNGILIALGFFFHFCWLLVCILFTVPMTIIFIMYLLHDEQEVDCFKLDHYGFLGSKEYCGQHFDVFWDKTKNTMECYLTMFASAILVTISLTYLMICASANYAYLRESRFTTYRQCTTDEQQMADSPSDHNSMAETKI